MYVTGYEQADGGDSDCITIAYSAAGVPLWLKRYTGSAQGKGITVNPNNGNVYVCASGDIAVLAYSADGTSLWTNTYANPTYPSGGACGVGVDASGRVYVAGSVGGMAARYVTIGYSSIGTPLWTNIYSGPIGTDQALDMAVDSRGNVYVTGWSWGGNGHTDYATVAYSSAGVPLWTNRFAATWPDPYNNTPLALAVDDSSGNVYVTGYASEEGAAGSGYATVAYSSSGTELWLRRHHAVTNHSDRGKAVAVGGNGNVYVTGTDAFGAATIAYTSAGTPVWTNHYDGTATAVTVDAAGNVIVAGRSWFPPYPNYDYICVAYSGSGIALWTNGYGLSGRDEVMGPHCLAAGRDGAIYLTGASEAGVTEFATIKYVPSPDIVLAEVARLPNLSCLLTLSAPTNVAYRLEGSSGLAGAWETLTNFPPLPVTSLQYTDTLAPLFPMRFYRTVWSP